MRTLHNALYKQNNKGNVIFNGIAQSIVKIYQLDFNEVASLRELWSALFTEHSVQSLLKEKN